LAYSYAWSTPSYDDGREWPQIGELLAVEGLLSIARTGAGRVRQDQPLAVEPTHGYPVIPPVPAEPDGVHPRQLRDLGERDRRDGVRLDAVALPEQSDDAGPAAVQQPELGVT
jgi:hypothetical protein